MRTAMLAACLILLMAPGAAAQHKSNPGKRRGIHSVVEAPPAPAIFKYVEQQAAFPGDVSEYIRTKLRYPPEALDYGVEGKAEVLFEIGIDGTVRVRTIRRSTGFGALDAEARRVVAGMPAWKPARINGVAVRTLLVLPVIFRLD